MINFNVDEDEKAISPLKLEPWDLVHHSATLLGLFFWLPGALVKWLSGRIT